jgi:hypothetical protein
MVDVRHGSGRRAAVTIINVGGSVIALILVAHIIFGLLHANPGNILVSTVAEWANIFGVWFVNLFNTGEPVLQLILNYGLAAVFWLIVAGLLARLVRSV